MSQLGLPFIGSVLLAGLLVSLSLWSRRRLRFKVATLGVLAAFVAVQFVALSDLLSRPKPLRLEWSPPDPEQTAVVASQMAEGQAIWLWMVRQGETEPRAYSLPWNEDMARQLHEARRESEQNGGAVRMRHAKSAQTIEGQRVFYAEPQATLPPKSVTGVEPAAGD